MPVKEGERVARGQLLAQLEARTYEALVAEAEANVDRAAQAVKVAEANLAAAGSSVSGSIADLERTRATLDQAELDFKRTERLAATGAVPEADLDAARTLERALLRRQARQLQRVVEQDASWRGEEPLWLIAPHLPQWLDEMRSPVRGAPGCYWVEPQWQRFLWIAANELPLVDELIRAPRGANEPRGARSPPGTVAAVPRS